MEIQEVIESLQTLQEYCYNRHAMDDNNPESPWSQGNEALDVAMDALEKQVPMRVIEGRFAGLYDCPKCEGAIESRGYQYCPSCGQKLDWRK